MIKKFSSITNIGVLRNIHSVQEECKLRQFNLIYGFNGSGKTTLTRILHSLEKGEISHRLPKGGKFRIELEDKRKITADENLNILKGKIAVFNADFVKENLRWNADEATPVYYIGAEHADLSGKLKEAEENLKKLGDSLEIASKAEETAMNAFRVFKTDTARTIGENISDRNFNARAFEKALLSVDTKEECALTEELCDEQKNLIRRPKPSPKIQHLSLDLKFSEFIKQSRDCLSTTVGTTTLKELMDHPKMVNWVSEGREYHRDKSLQDCLFCGNTISENRLKDIDKAIDHRFDQIIREVKMIAEKCDVAQKLVNAALGKIPSKNDFNVGSLNAEEYLKSYEVRLGEALHVLNACMVSIDLKLASPNVAIELTNYCDTSRAKLIQDGVDYSVGLVNECIDQHNAGCDQFEEVKKNAQKLLLNHYLAIYRDRYEELKEEYNISTANLKETQHNYNMTTDKIDGLTRQLQDNAPAAKAINLLIRDYLRHNEVELNPLEDGGFKLMRFNKDTQDTLSEGEKTAIALCYFLSSLKSNGKQISEQIVVVDDPISSLDSRTLNYAFNLLTEQLKCAKQLIILTHNLDFMNECKKWMNLSRYKEISSKLFLDLKAIDGQRQTEICQLPKLLRDFESEYHFLFAKVNQLAKMQSVLDYEYLYLMPNAMRKVLEVFLSFKLPSKMRLSGKVREISRLADKFGLNSADINALTRLVDLESHGDSLEDLVSFSSMSVEETHSSAKRLMSIIERVDEDHFKIMKEQC